LHSPSKFAKVACNQKSGKEVAKTNMSAERLKPGRYTAKFWESRVFRPVYVDRHGQRQECSTYYVRVKHAGTRKAVPLSTSDRSEAGRQAARFYGRLRAIGWDEALKEHDPQQSVKSCALTVSDVITALSCANLRDRTRSNYASALRWFAARKIGFEIDDKTFGPEGSKSYRQKVEAVRLTELSATAVKIIIEGHQTAAGRDARDQLSARISAASFLRNAKAAISIVRRQGVKLPDPEPFAGVTGPKGIQAPKYVSTFDAGKLVREAKLGLANNPPAYVAFLLALGAGLRHSEILNLRWRHVDKDQSRVLVLSTGAWQAKNVSSEAAVNVDPGLLVEIEPFRAGSDVHVTNRVAINELISWLRDHGIDGHKPLHTLRKECGSLVCAEADLLAASSTIAVTAAVYVENRKSAAPKISAMLNPAPPPKPNGNQPARKRVGRRKEAAGRSA
jgi:integrase